MAANPVTNSVTATPTLRDYRWLDNGDYILVYDWMDANGVTRGRQELYIRSDGTGIYSMKGDQLMATTPAGLLTALSALKTNTETGLNSLVAAGKINF